MATLFALIDSDNFYVSVERIFDSTLHGRPVVVLSSGDGNIIARSNEAKALGIAMGAPVFRYQRLIKEHHIATYSSNFQLYQDISDRIAGILSTFSEQPPERYSIDECFLSLSHLAPEEAETVGREIRARILQCVGVPCSVGIARSKVLTKVAVKLVKGVCPWLEQKVGIGTSPKEPWFSQRQLRKALQTWRKVVEGGGGGPGPHFPGG